MFLVRGEMDSAQVALRQAYALDDSREKFDMVWQDRIRMISPEALEQARSMLVEVGGAHFQVREMPAPPAPPAAGSGVSSRAP